MVTGDLTSAFRPYRGETIQQPEFLPKDAFLESIHKAKFKKVPDSYKALTAEEIAVFNKGPQASPYGVRQEPGTRPSCALPYCMKVDGRLSEDKHDFELSFVNDDTVFGASTAGAPFNVYAPGVYAATGQGEMMEAVRTWAYGVKPGDRLADSWPLKDFDYRRYHLRVYGANGFYREFKGDVNDPAVHIAFDYEAAKGAGNALSGNGELHLSNSGTTACTIEILDRSYGAVYPSKPLAAGETAIVLLPLEKSHGWYDVSVRVKGMEGFEKRYAGRIETGKDSVSDPAMA
jgi:phospholipase C